MCTELQKPLLFGSSPTLMGASSLHTSTNGPWWPHLAGLSLWHVWSGDLVHSTAWVHFWSLAWGTTLYSFDSLLQGGNFSSCKSAGTIALPHPKLTACFCSCIPHIIYHPEMTLSLPSFPDSPLLNCLWSSVSYFNSVSSCGPEAFVPLGHKAPAPTPPLTEEQRPQTC